MKNLRSIIILVTLFCQVSLVYGQDKEDDIEIFEGELAPFNFCVTYGRHYSELGYNCEIGNFKRVKELIEAGASVHFGSFSAYFQLSADILISTVDPDGENFEMVKYLLSLNEGLGKSHYGESYYTILDEVANYPDEIACEYINLFLENGIHINHSGISTCEEALWITLVSNNVKAAKLLLSKGRNVAYNVPENWLVAVAAELKDPNEAVEITKILIEKGVYIEDFSLKKAIEVAREKENIELLEILSTLEISEPREKNLYLSDRSK